MARSVRFHSLCLLPSWRHAISRTMPVALSAALELLLRLSFAALSAKIRCGFAVLCFSGTASRGHSCRLFSACRAVLGSQSAGPFLAFLIRMSVMVHDSRRAALSREARLKPPLTLGCLSDS